MEIDYIMKVKNMTSREIMEQQIAIIICVALTKSPTEAVKELEEVDNISKVSHAFVYTV